jgi:hypothetical protein
MKHYTTFLLLAALCFSCVDEETRVLPPVAPVETGKNVVLTMQIPGTYLPVTYAYNEADENEIRTVDALVFRVDSTGKEYYYNHITVVAVSHQAGNAKNIQLRLEPVDSRVIILANVRHLFTDAMKEQLRRDSLTADATKEKVMKRFVFDMPEPIGRQKEAFPMYGESEIIRPSDELVKDITMMRSITRIDIVNSTFDSRVTIDSVYLFHTKNKGYVAPRFDAKGAITALPNLPPDAEPNKQVFAYKFTANAGTVSPAMEREIYLTEDSQETDYPTIVVLKILSDTRPPQFYRVDMLTKDKDLLPIQRNCRYRINITKIMSDGYPTVEAAAAVSKPSLSSTVDANELGISTVVFNDLYKLGVSTTEIAFNADGSWNGQKPDEKIYSLKVHTTYSGWSPEWEAKEPAGWLNLTPSSTLALNVKATPNTTGKTRVGKIKLTAGTLHIEVNVTQASGTI